MAEILVETHDLTKRYGSSRRSGSVLAVNNLNMSVEEGEIYGFLGPNGSGKTTTILMLLGLTEPTSGYARVTGLDPLHDPLEVKRNVGYLPENVGFYDDMTGRQNMRYTGQLNRIPKREADDRIDRLLDSSGCRRPPIGPWPDTPGACGRGWASPTPCSSSPGWRSSTTRPSDWTQRAYTSYST